MDFHVSSFSALVFFGGCRADAGRTSTRVFADASAYFLRASFARFWAVAAARRRAVSRAPVWKSTSESGAAVLPKSRGQNRHAPSGEAPRKMSCALARALGLVGARLSPPLRFCTPQLSLALHRLALLPRRRCPFARPPPCLLHASRPRPRLRRRGPRPHARLRLWCCPLSVVRPVARVAPLFFGPALAPSSVRGEGVVARHRSVLRLGKGRLWYGGP